MQKQTMKYETILRRMRQRIFNYPPEKQTKAERVLLKVKARHMAQIKPQIDKSAQRRSERMLRLWA